MDRSAVSRISDYQMFIYARRRLINILADLLPDTGEITPAILVECQKNLDEIPSKPYRLELDGPRSIRIFVTYPGALENIRVTLVIGNGDSNGSS